MVRATAIWRVLMVMLTLCAAFYFGCSSGDTQSKALPIIPLDEIESIYVHREFNAPSFMVPKDRWIAVLSSLSPYKRDPSPAKWTVYRDVTVKLKNGSERELFLFRTSGQAAFAMGQSEKDRIYYRGGSDERMVEAIEAAANDADLELPRVPVEGLQTVRVVQGYDPEEGGFILREDLWQPLLECLEPRQYYATADPPSRSKALYTVGLVYNDGDEIKIFVFSSERDAAYAVSGKKNGYPMYFRGGQHSRLIDLLRVAHVESYSTS